MERDAKLRLKRVRRRERAERMHAARECDGDLDSAEDEVLAAVKPPRPPQRRKKALKEAPVFDEDIIDGFAILAFKTYEDLETAVKMAAQKSGKIFNNITLGAEKRPPPQRVIRRHSPALVHDAGTSDDSGRASEARPPIGALGHRDSSHDRLSDASSRCSSGRGYICDSEGEDDKVAEPLTGGASPPQNKERKKKKKKIAGKPDEGKPTAENNNGSDAGSVFAATPASTPRLHEPPSTPLTNGLASSPIQGRPAPSPGLAGPGPPVACPGPTVGPTQPPIKTEPLSPPPSLPSRLESVQFDKPADKRTLEGSARLPPREVPRDVPREVPPAPRDFGNVANSHPRDLSRDVQAIPSRDAAMPRDVTRDASMAHAPVSGPTHAAIPNPAPTGSHSHSPALPNNPPNLPALPSYNATTAAVKKPRPPSTTPTSSVPSPSPLSISNLSTPAVTSTASVPAAPPPVQSVPTAITALPPPSGAYGMPPLAANSPYPSYPPLYAPYSTTLQHSPYLPPRVDPPITGLSSPKLTPLSSSSSAVAPPVVTTSTATRATPPALSAARMSPRVHSPSTRDRESYSSAVSSLSRSSVTPVSGPINSVPSATPAPYPKVPVWGVHQPSGPVPPARTFPPAPIFAPPAAPLQPSAPAPFSAESLFQSNQADMLRRELDSRFLASQERSLTVGPGFLRTEMHHHQHQHTHVHQHQVPPIFPKLGPVSDPFYRYPTFTPGLLGPGLSSTPFAPPTLPPTFTPKTVGDTTKSRIVKSGKWNAMHVRVAWEIYHHQQQQKAAAEGKTGMGSKETLLRPPSSIFPPTAGPRPHDLAGYASGFMPPHLGSGVSPFGRYPPGGFAAATSTGFPPLGTFPPRDIPPIGSLPSVHDPWRLRGPAGFPVGPSPWNLKPDPATLERREIEEREREREREREKERIRREREERERDRERREREEKRKLEAERERREKERRELERREMERLKARERSPLRNGQIKEERTGKEDEVMMLSRGPIPGPYPPHPYSIARHAPPHGALRPPPMGPPFAPPSWPPPPSGGDPYAYRSLDPLRYNPIMFRTEEEEHRAKLYGLSPFLPPAHHQPSPPSLLKKEDNR